MEDCDPEEMVYYSSDSLERVFSTMGEFAAVGSNFLRMEQHLGKLVEALIPSLPDIRVP